MERKEENKVGMVQTRKELSEQGKGWVGWEFGRLNVIAFCLVAGNLNRVISAVGRQERGKGGQ